MRRLFPVLFLNSRPAPLRASFMLAAALLLVAAAALAQRPVTVDTQDGPITGITWGSSDEFLSVPYAAPPSMYAATTRSARHTSSGVSALPPAAAADAVDAAAHVRYAAAVVPTVPRGFRQTTFSS